MERLTFYIVPLALLGTFGFLSAATYGGSSDFLECKYTGGPVETTLCAGKAGWITYNTPVDTTQLPVLISIDHEINDAGGLAWFSFLRCNGGPCSSTNIVTQLLNGWGIVGEQPSGSFNSPSNLTPGTYPITMWHAPSAGGGDVTCLWYGSPQCELLGLGDQTDGGALVVTAPSASVNLNISMWFDKVLKNIFSAFVADVAQARGW